MIQFILTFVIATAVFFLLYRLFLRPLSFLAWNRVTLLAIPILAALILPLSKLLPSTSIPAQLVSLPEISVSGQQLTGSISAEGFNAPWLLILYGIGVAVFLVRLGLSLKTIYEFRQTAKAEHRHDVYFWTSDRVPAPCAFMDQIFIPTEMLNSAHLSAVLVHEQAHVRQRHGIDNLYYGVLLTVFWFSPFLHLLFRELRQVHECLADAQTIRSRSRETYSLFLLDNLFGKDILLPAMGIFNSSFIKIRITMIYKERSASWKKIAYLIVLPVCLILTAFACSKDEIEVVQNPEPMEVMETRSEAINKSFSDQDVDKNPVLTGLGSHLAANLKYPEEARQSGLECQVFLSLLVDEEGHISVEEVLTARLSGQLDGTSAFTQREIQQKFSDAAIAAVESAPKYLPAEKDGKAVPCKVALPVRFSLGDK